jgi:hypothetical protein
MPTEVNGMRMLSHTLPEFRETGGIALAAIGRRQHQILERSDVHAEPAREAGELQVARVDLIGVVGALARDLTETVLKRSFSETKRWSRLSRG